MRLLFCVLLRKMIKRPEGAQMKILIFLSQISIPLVIFLYRGLWLVNKCKVYEEFVKGAKDGLKTVAGILPTLIGLMVAVGVLRASGFLDSDRREHWKDHRICRLSGGSWCR